MATDLPAGTTRDGSSPPRGGSAPGERSPGGDGGSTSAPPTISLPRGGGAIRGIGEKFAANPVTGTGSMSVPIATSPGRSGFGPELSLSYDSGAGNGPFGFGWSLGLPQITRKTDKGLPQYRDAEESDVFILSGAEHLVPVLDAGGSRYEDSTSVPDHTIHRYRPRVEGLFARIERWTRRSDGDVHWRSISRDNVLTLYGKDENSRIFDPADPQRIFTWLICETRDDKGNGVLYEYKPEDGAGVDPSHARERNRGDRDDARRTVNRYLKRIRYGNRETLLDAGRRPRFLSEDRIRNAGWMFEMVFDYSEHDDIAPTPGDGGEWTQRADAFSSYRAGFEVRTRRLCRRVLMFHHFEGEEGVGADCLVRSTDFTYSHQQDPEHARNPVYTFLLAVTQTGHKRHDDGYDERRPPPQEVPPAERTAAIRSITYNAKGQREQITFGNPSVTAYEYDPETFRIVRLNTIRTSDGVLLQDLQYTYDPVGIITEIRDDAQQAVYFANAVVEPRCCYRYDALYRLIHADGREHAAQNSVQRDNTPFATITGDQSRPETGAICLARSCY